MLQPRQSTPDQQLITARIIWAALTMSMIFYGVVLFVTGKVSRLEELSTVPTLFQYIAIMGNLIALGVYWFFKNKVVTEPVFERRFSFYIVCWAMSEAIVLLGFMAVFLTDDGNGFLYLTNLLVGLTSNIVCFPKK